MPDSMKGMVRTVLLLGLAGALKFSMVTVLVPGWFRLRLIANLVRLVSGGLTVASSGMRLFAFVMLLTLG